MVAQSKKAEKIRARLATAFESKIQQMEMPALLRLEKALDGRIEALSTAKPSRFRGKRLGRRVLEGTPPEREDIVLKGGGLGSVVSEEEGKARLDAIAVDDSSADWAESELVGAGDLVERLKVSRGTVDNWRKAGKIVAFRKGLRNYVYPLRQFRARAPADGIDKVLLFFSDSEEAWEWLVAPNRMTAGEPPIEWLLKGEIEPVERAAAGRLDYA